MPRYYFHIRVGDRLIEDEEGLEFATVEQARREALASVADRIRDASFASKPFPAEELVVTDQYGHEIVVFPIFPSMTPRNSD
jgi:hypothetical protein